jgi:hypothetical protein
MRRFTLFGVVLAVLAVVYLTAWRTQPAASRMSAQGAAPQIVAVTSVTRSCPPPAPGTGASHVAMIAVPPRSASAATGTGAAASGSATLSAVPAAPARTPAPARAAVPGTQPVTVSAPGALTTVTAPGAAGLGGTEVAANGQMAAGFEAEQADAAGTGLVTCTHPGSDMWFVGTGAGTGASQIRLYLVNTGDLAASADVTILTDSGPQPGPGSGITVGPRESVVEDIAPFVRGSITLALHVQTSSGQVAAAVWEGGGSGGAWLPQAAAPSTQLVIPGLTVAGSAARLFVAVPGTTDAQLKVVAFTAAGRFPQFGSAPVDAPAGASTSFALSSLGASAAGLALSSNVPVVAGVLVPGTGIGSFTTAVAPVTEQGVVAGNPGSRGVTVGLVLTAPGAAARADITTVGTGTSAAGGQQVAMVPAGHTLALAVPRPGGSRQPFAIVITPLAGSGPLYAARVVTTGTGGLSAPVASLLPVPNALTVITLPPVRDTYSAVLP